MPNPDSMLEQMQQCEENLLHSDYSHSTALAERWLHEQFEEVSSRGQISSRAAVLQWLQHKNPADRWHFADFQVEELSSSLCLVRYIASKIPATDAQIPASNGARHVSLWQYHALEECWQLRFHQATKL